MFTPGVPGGVSSLTPLTAARVPEDDTAAVNAMRLPTPTMDLTPLGRGVPTETVPFPAPAWASRPGRGDRPGDLGAAEMGDDFDIDDGELSAEAAEATTEGARNGTPATAPRRRTPGGSDPLRQDTGRHSGELRRHSPRDDASTQQRPLSA